MKEYDAKNVSEDDAQCLSESPKALLVLIAGREHWVPKSQIHDDSEVYKRGDRGKLVMSKWIATERGLWEREED